MPGIFSSDAEMLVGLNAEAPFRMSQAVSDGSARVGDDVGTVHGLKQEVIERKIRKAFGWGVGLRVNQFQFVATDDFQLRARLGTDANPVDAFRRSQGAVGFDGDAETAAVKRAHKVIIHLQQRFSSCEHAETIGFAAGPFLLDRVGECIGVAVSAALGAVRSDKVGVAEGTDRGATIRFPATPEIAA